MFTLLAAVAATAVAAAAAGTLSASPLAASWWGYNPGDHAVKAGYWRTPKFNAAVGALAPSSLRFPSGTAANYWNWTLGCEMPCSSGTSKLEDFAVTLNATGAAAVLVVNMLTDTLPSQLAFLARAANLGIAVASVELGNEFYNSHSDYEAAFPDGAAYGAAASTWVAAIRAAHPAAAIAVVVVPSYRDGNNPRITGWNAGLFGAVVGLRAGDGVVMHEYDATGAGAGAAFKEKDVPVMLGTPFVTAARIAATAVPAGLGIWVTEFNLLYSTSKPDVPAFGTWAHGLYVAAEAVLLLGVPAVAAGRLNKHCLVAYAFDGVLFEDATSFDFAMSPDTSLATARFGESASAVTLALVGNATRGATAAATLALAVPPPPLVPGGHPSVIGVGLTRGGGGGGDAALLLNLGSAAYTLSPADAAAFAAFEQVSVADALTAVNDAATQVTRGAGRVPGTGLTLPPYSVTRLAA